MVHKEADEDSLDHRSHSITHAQVEEIFNEELHCKKLIDRNWTELT
jgi:hypothetical protein